MVLLNNLHHIFLKYKACSHYLLVQDVNQNIMFIPREHMCNLITKMLLIFENMKWRQTELNNEHV